MPPKKRPAAAAEVAKEEPAKKPKKEKVVGHYVKYKGDKIPEPNLPRKKAPGGLTAICWNVAGLRALLNKRLETLQKLVEEEKPAILGFLEHKLQEGEQVAEVTEQLRKAFPKYSATFTCSQEKKGYSGVAVLIRDDLESKVSCVKLEAGANEGRTLCVELPKLFVVMCYVMNSGDALQRLQERVNQWDPALRDYLKGLAAKKPVAILGDLSVAHRDVDIWNLEAPHIPKTPAMTAEERASFGKLLEAGFVDTFAHLHPEAMGAFTYWSVRARARDPNRGFRLDYALVSDSIMKDQGKSGIGLVDAFHLSSFAPNGDHCPVGLTLSGAL